MQLPLKDLSPHWVDDGPRGGLGVRFQCPCQHDHELFAWFTKPRDGLPQIKEGQLYQHSGETFDEGKRGLCLYPPLECGDCLVVVYNGRVNVIYLD